MSKTIFAFIFARGGSKGIKRKNLKLLKGKPLIYYSVEIARKLRMVKKIFVCTEDKEIAKYANSLGVEIIKRPKKLAQHNSPEFHSWKYAVNYCDNLKFKFDLFLSLPATSPLRKKSDVLNTIKKLNNKTDLAISATETNRNPWFNMIKKKKNGFYELVNKSNGVIFNRQDAPKVYDMTTIAFVTTPEYIRKNNSIHEGNLNVNFSRRINSIDIDDYTDLTLARKLSK